MKPATTGRLSVFFESNNKDHQNHQTEDRGLQTDFQIFQTEDRGLQTDFQIFQTENQEVTDRRTGCLEMSRL